MSGYLGAVRFVAEALGLDSLASEREVADRLRSDGLHGDDSTVINAMLRTKEIQTAIADHHRWLKSAEFLTSYEWRQLRMKVLTHYGTRCQCCGISPDEWAIMNVDHIRPRKTHPWLALDFDNLQVLCNECNHGKGNWDATDWRPGCFADAYIAH